MVVLLRHKDEVIGVRTSPTCECDGQFTQPENLSFRGFRFAHHSLRHLASPSLPLFSASPSGSRPGAGSRGQGCVYGEVARVLDSTSSSASSARRGWHQPVGRRSIEALLEPHSKPWLNATPSIDSVVKINISMIVCRPKRCRRYTTGWCLMNPSENPRPN